MSAIKIQGFNPDSSQPLMAAVIGDTIDLQPLDSRFTYEYAVASSPGGSSASFSGSTITPDVAGAYTFTVASGSDILAVPFFVFASSVYSSIATDQLGHARPDPLRRQILKGVGNAVGVAALVAWNGGTFPPGVDARFQQFGGV